MYGMIACTVSSDEKEAHIESLAAQGKIDDDYLDGDRQHKTWRS